MDYSECTGWAWLPEPWKDKSMRVFMAAVVCVVGLQACGTLSKVAARPPIVAWMQGRQLVEGTPAEHVAYLEAQTIRVAKGRAAALEHRRLVMEARAQKQAEVQAERDKVQAEWDEQERARKAAKAAKVLAAQVHADRMENDSKYAVAHLSIGVCELRSELRDNQADLKQSKRLDRASGTFNAYDRRERVAYITELKSDLKLQKRNIRRLGGRPVGCRAVDAARAAEQERQRAEDCSDASGQILPPGYCDRVAS